ncbi:uncharacterized protein LOC129764721 isoform X2 [Toxorhynchites rutilus septentrionalis]|nr:uncharacterized protein LOC129764721 isoform X2 [Toxorhynchites rutilus septentrionalis]
MTLNSTSNEYSDGMTVAVPSDLPGKHQQQQQKQQQNGIITITKPKPPTVMHHSTTSPAAQVKMCGYLKKKRNKMGGWRKMYFILQNQLLLSYSSKDDYEKKLAPFKDIINLVPGTVIIPTTGPRFTIETNSKVLYTFRCDDHKGCSEWITALLDSLKGDGSGSDKKYSQSLHGGNLHPQLARRSMSSLSSSSSSGSSTRSTAAAAAAAAAICYATDDPSKMTISSIRRLHPLLADSTRQASLSTPKLFYGFASNGTGGGNIVSSKAKVGGKLVQLPIAGGTARLLERGGVNNGPNKYQILTINEVDDDGENDEKPTAVAAAARDISNGNSSSRGDPGIKVSTQTQGSGNLRERIDEVEGNDGSGGETGEGKNVKSRSTPVTTTAAVNRSTSEQSVGAVGSGSGGSGRKKSTAEATAALLNNNNFRLHTNLGKMHQSVEVCRINSMFGRQKSTAGKRLNAGGIGSATNNSDSNCSLAASIGDLRPNKAAGGYHLSCNNNHREIIASAAQLVGGSAKDLRRSSSSPPGRPDLPLLPATTMMAEPKSLTDVNHNSLSKWSAESITIELTASGFTLGGSRCAGSTDTLNRKTSDEFAALKSRSRSNSCTSYLHLTSHRFSSKTDLNRTPSAGGGQSQSRNKVGSKRNIYEEFMAPPRRANSAEDGHSLASEPIYAVVDLKVKKARRLNQLNSSFREQQQHEESETEDEPQKSDQTIKADMMRDKETGRLKERSKSSANDKAGVTPMTSNDYEELNELTIENIADFEDSSDEAENIYEPINIPEAQLSSSSTSLPSPQQTAGGSSQMNNLWRNLKKMNLNHLIKRSTQDHHQTPAKDTEDFSAKASPHPTAFSELSKKFGHHRRSIKNRMRILCDRSQSSDGPKLSQSDEKLRKNSANGQRQQQQQLLLGNGASGGGSFGRNKKSRKSLSLDDFLPRKKHHQQQHMGNIGVGVLSKTDKVNDKLHKELKRQLSKRSDRANGGSSSIEL